jgi:transcriptional regulator with XRE-family HTH domain
MRGVQLPKVRNDKGEDFRNTPEYAERLRKVFSRHLQKMLRDRGWSQSELMRRANDAMPKGATKITRDNISRYVAKENFPGPERLEAIRRAFNCKMEELLPENEWLTEHEYLAAKKRTKWDVSMETRGRTTLLKIDAEVPFEVAAKVMEMLQQHAPSGDEMAQSEDDE